MQKYIDICKSIAVVAGFHRSYHNNNNNKISRSKPEHLKRLQLNQMKNKKNNYKLKM